MGWYWLPSRVLAPSDLPSDYNPIFVYHLRRFLSLPIFRRIFMPIFCAHFTYPSRQNAVFLEGYYTYFDSAILYNVIRKAKYTGIRKEKDMHLYARKNKKKAPELVTPEANFKIYGFMRTSLGLERTELLIYALIYSYFRSGTPFTASREYIAQWVGCGKSALDTAISSLVTKGYINKTQVKYRGVNVLNYCINVSSLPPIADHLGMLKLALEDRIRHREV